jgi:hypothetical protein
MLPRKTLSDESFGQILAEKKGAHQLVGTLLHEFCQGHAMSETTQVFPPGKASSADLDRLTPTATQLKALGYTDRDTVYYRAIHPTKGARKIQGVGLTSLPQVQQSSDDGFNLYLVVNGGGHSDAEVTAGRAIFYEHDNLEKSLQVDLWRSLSLPEPTFQVDTGGKSIHSYWVFEEPIAIGLWRTLQADLLAYSDGDRSIKNPSRVMRLAGFKHQATGQAASIITNSGQRYTVEAMRVVIPAPAMAEKPQRHAQTPQNVGAVPLLVCLAPSTRNLIRDGAGEGTRNDTGAAVARDLLGTAAALGDMGVRFDGDPWGLFGDYSRNCSPAIDDREADQIWRSAEQSNPGASLSPDKIKGCIAAWEKRQQRPARVKNQEVTEPDSTADRPVSWGYLATCGNNLGRWKGEGDDRRFEPLLGCNFDVVSKMSSLTGECLELRVRWDDGPRVCEKQILLFAKDYEKRDNFKSGLNSALGAVIPCKLKEDDLTTLIASKKAEYAAAGGITRKLASTFGGQGNGVFVFPDRHFVNGVEVAPADSDWVFNPSLGVTDGIKSPNILPANNTALSELVAAARAFYHLDTLPHALCVLGHSVATLHRDILFKTYKQAPQNTIDGPPGCGKTIAATMGASIAGTHGLEFVVGQNTTESARAERLMLCRSLPIVWDDPIPLGGEAKEIKVARKILGSELSRLFNGQSRDKRGGGQAANTNVTVTSNAGAGGVTAAGDERIIVNRFPDRPVNLSKGEGDRLARAMDAASGGLGQLLRIPFDRDRIDSHTVELLNQMPNAHARQALGLAIQAYYTEQFCQIAGVTDFDALAFTKAVLCPQANDTCTAKSALTDFLERLDNLQTNGLIGQWNAAIVKKGGDRYLAIRQTDLWEILQRDQSSNLPNYGISAIKSEIVKKGGLADSRQKFVSTRQAWQEYVKAESLFRINTGNDSAVRGPTPPVRDKSYACWLIPARVVEEALGRPWDGNSETEPGVGETEQVQDLVVGDFAIVTQDTPEGLRAGQRFKILSLHFGAKPEDGNFATLGTLDGQPAKNSEGVVCICWLTALRPATEADRLGAWEVAA